MNYVFIFDSLRENMSNNSFIKTIGSSLIGQGITENNFLMISENNSCVILELPFGSKIKGDIYFVNNKGIKILDEFYNSDKFCRKKIFVFYNSCACDKEKFEKIESYIYCINKKSLIEFYIKNIGVSHKLVENGDWLSFNQLNL